MRIYRTIATFVAGIAVAACSSAPSSNSNLVNAGRISNTNFSNNASSSPSPNTLSSPDTADVNSASDVSGESFKIGDLHSGFWSGYSLQKDTGVKEDWKMDFQPISDDYFGELISEDGKENMQRAKLVKIVIKDSKITFELVWDNNSGSKQRCSGEFKSNRKLVGTCVSEGGKASSTTVFDLNRLS